MAADRHVAPRARRISAKPSNAAVAMPSAAITGQGTAGGEQDAAHSPSLFRIAGRWT